MSRKEERRYTAAELAEKYQGSVNILDYGPEETVVDLQTVLKVAIQRSAQEYVNHQWPKVLENIKSGKLGPREAVAEVQERCYRDGDSRHVAIKESVVNAMVRDGYLIPRTTPLEKQWQKRREAELIDREEQRNDPYGKDHGRGGRS